MSEVRDEKNFLNQIKELQSQMMDIIEQFSECHKGADLKSEEQYMEEAIKDVLIGLSCDMYWEYDPLNNIVKFSKPFSDVVGWHNLQEVSLTKFLDYVPLQHRKAINKSFYNLLQKESKVEEFDYQFLHADGTKDWYHARCSYVLDAQSNVVKIIGINNDVTKHKIKNDLIEREQAKNELLISFANNFIWEYDCVENCFTANASLYDKLGLEHRKYAYEEIAKLHEQATPLHLKELVEKEALSGHGVVHIYSEKENANLIFDINYGGLRDSTGSVYRIIGTADDITEKEMLMATAARDPLTNVYNRRMGNLRLHSSFERYKEYGEFFTIVFFDIDKFKYVNDKYGHDMGDYVLKAVCDTISKEIRSTDMLFRWGGDELLLICSGIMKENIYANIDRIRTIIENTKFEYNNEVLHLTVSIGAAYFYKNDHDEQQAVKRADRSLYKAKLAGRNKVCILL